MVHDRQGLEERLAGTCANTVRANNTLFPFPITSFALHSCHCPMPIILNAEAACVPTLTLARTPTLIDKPCTKLSRTGNQRPT
jgi:hypothetical protein